jgi:hypothetical protein
MSKYKILFVTMNYTIPVNGVAQYNGAKFWFKYKNIDNMSNIDYNNLEYIISELSDHDYKIIYDNHQDFCKKSGNQFYHTNDDDLLKINNINNQNNFKENINNQEIKEYINNQEIKEDFTEDIKEDINNQDFTEDIKEDINNQDFTEDIKEDINNQEIKEITQKFESMMNSVVHINKINYMKIKGNYITTIKSDNFINFYGTNIVNNKI